MKTLIVLSISFILIISCSTSFQSVKPINVTKQQTIIDKIHPVEYSVNTYDGYTTIPCHTGRCLCDKRLIELQDFFEESFYFSNYYYDYLK